MSTPFHSSTDHPSFNSEELQKTFNKYALFFDMHQERLNGITADFLNAEKYLQLKGVQLPFEFKCEGLTSSKDPTAWFVLRWDEHSQQKRYRLHCRRMTTGTFGEDIVVDEKVVVEAPVQVKLKYYKYLGPFIKGLASELGTANGYVPKDPTLPRTFVGRKTLTQQLPTSKNETP